MRIRLRYLKVHPGPKKRHMSQKGLQHTVLGLGNAQGPEAEKGRHAKKYVKGIVPQFVDRLFSETANFAKDSVTAEEKKDRERGVRRFNNWKNLEAIWFRFLTRFGSGALFLLPDDLTDEK